MARESDTKSTVPVLFNVGTGASAFICIPAVKNQVGLILQIKGTGGSLEIAGGGLSAASQLPTFTVAGNSPTLLPNGSGWPVPATAILTFSGSPYIWLSSGGATTVVAALYLKDSSSGA